MNHSFNIEIAVQYGVNESIMLENLHFWIIKNKANEQNFYNDNYWTYNSQKAFTELFPYWSKKQIQRILSSLENKGLIIKGNYNKSPYDRTSWYTLTEKALIFYRPSIIPNGIVDNPKREHGESEKVSPIPDINTDIKPNIKITTTKDGFDGIINTYTEDEELKETIYDFIKMRKAIKKPMTDAALKLTLKKLNKLTGLTIDNDTKIEILNQSIMNSWQGIFPLKQEQNTNGYNKNVQAGLDLVAKYEEEERRAANDKSGDS